MGLEKLQPHRTMHLRGFDDRGAAASLHHVSPTGFRVSGIFRDPADFCVLVLYDADNFFEHPHLKYLPDFNFDGVNLTFDVEYVNLQPLDSAKFPTIAWPYLSFIREDGTPGTISLFDPQPSLVGGAWTQAQASFTITAAPAVAFDRVTIWFQNIAFDYIAAGGETASAVAQALVDQINGFNFGLGIALDAVRTGSTVTVLARRAGRDGNFLTLYAQHKTPTLTITPATNTLSGGSSEATWRISIDFTARGLTAIRQMWLTFSPALKHAGVYVAQEWEARFTNWTVTGANKALRLAGPQSVRVEHDDDWVSLAGSGWALESGFYSRGFAYRAVGSGDRAVIRYTCQAEHEVWLGTSLYSDRGKWKYRIDGGAWALLDCYLVNEPAVNTRRRLFTGITPGEHVVEIEWDSGGPVYFDFLEAVVPVVEPPEPAEISTDLSPAMDYGTDHTYKLPPARVLWMNSQLGYRGPLNVYVSVYWWNQRKRSGAVTPFATITFTGIAGDTFVTLSGFTMGKSVFPADTDASVAAHFAHFLNGISTGVWAEATGNQLKIHARSPVGGAAYTFTVSATTAGGGSVSVANFGPATAGRWDVDELVSPSINFGTREWLRDLCEQCAAGSRELTLAYSMELLNPPDSWAARYPNGDPVTTATGFGTNFTTHCSFTPDVLAYHKQVFADTAAIMATAGLKPILQVGEFLWWFFNNNTPPTDDTADPNKGMAYYDAYVQSRANAAFGRNLARFSYPGSDPAVNSYADANLLRSILDQYIRDLRTHVRGLYPDAEIEILLPVDVNYPTQYGRYTLGGRLNHYVNIPETFLDPATAPFDRVKMEALDFGAGTRSGDLAAYAITFPFELGKWPRNKVRYLIPVFNGGCPFGYELRLARAEQLAGINTWAHDHVHIFGWTLSEPEDSCSVSGN